ncbi:MAG: hypothetical protein ACLU80_11505 [Dorea sp.]
MKQLIFREGILLAVPLDTPLGLLFGFLIAKVSFNWLVEQEIWYRPESRTIRCLCFH